MAANDRTQEYQSSVLGRAKQLDLPEVGSNVHWMRLKKRSFSR